MWLTSDTQEMLNCSDDIIRGIKAVLQYTGIPKCIIGIENNKPECIDLLCKKTNGDSTIEVKALPSVYGTGAELILIECLGRENCHGVTARRRRRHRDERDQCVHPGQVSGHRHAGGGAYHHRGRRRLRKASSQNVVVPVGTSYQDIIDFAGVKGTLGKVVAGGAMMGAAGEPELPHHRDDLGLILLSGAAASRSGQSLHPLRPLRGVLPHGPGARGGEPGLCCP